MPTDLKTYADQLSADLASVRAMAMNFAEKIEGDKGASLLATFNQVTYFHEASKVAYDHLVARFEHDRRRFGVYPEFDDYDIRTAYRDQVRVRDVAALKGLDIKAVVHEALSGLDQLLPASDVESTINSQLANRVFKTLELEYREVVEKGGKTVLKFSAACDAFAKKWSKKNNYSYYTSERIRNQIGVLCELVSVFNSERDKAYSTRLPHWHEIDAYGKDLSRSTYAVEVLGLELKLRMSSFEWHLPQEFATFMSEFISLHHRR